MTLIENNSRRHTVLPLAAFSFLLLTASSALANPVNDVDVPARQAEFEPRTIQEQIQLAGDYLAGHRVAQDSKRAAFWYEKAAGERAILGPSSRSAISMRQASAFSRDPVRAFHGISLPPQVDWSAPRRILALPIFLETGLKRISK